MPLLTLPIVESRHETPRNLVVRLGLGGRPFPFLAGQHVLLGEAGQGDRRPYSISSAPEEAAEAGLLEFLIQVDESGSPGPHLPSLAPGRCLTLEGPAGSFTLPPDPVVATEFLFVGGGTGIAPIRSMIGHLLATRPAVRPGLVHTARTPEELSYASEFRELARLGRLRLIESVTREAPVGWGGVRGRVTASHLAPLVAARGTLAFVCGPDSLVDAVPPILASLGVAGTRTEHWAG